MGKVIELRTKNPSIKESLISFDIVRFRKCYKKQKINFKEERKVLRKFRKICKKNEIKGIEFLEEYVKNNKAGYRIYKHLGQKYFALGFVEKAIENYHKALAINPKYLSIYLDISNFYFMNLEYEKCKEYMKLAQKALPFNPKVYLKLAYIFIQERNEKEALRYLKLARQLAYNKSKKDNSLICAIEYLLLDIYALNQDYNRMIELAKSLHKLGVKNEKTFAVLAEANEKLKNYEEAIYWYKELLSKFEKNVYVIRCLTNLYIQEERYDEAIECIEKTMGLLRRKGASYKQLQEMLALVKRYKMKKENIKSSK